MAINLLATILQLDQRIQCKMEFWQMINIEEIGTESGTQLHQVMKTIGIARSTFPGLSLP